MFLEQNSEIITYTPLANFPTILVFDEKAIAGNTANGNCILINAFKKSFIPLKLDMSE